MCGHKTSEIFNTNKVNKKSLMKRELNKEVNNVRRRFYILKNILI